MNKNNPVPLHRFWGRELPGQSIGEMVEWSITTVLKTVVLRGTGGSNPSLSAINVENQQITKRTPNFTPKNVKLGVFILFKNNVEHLQSFDEIKHRHTLNEVGDVAEGKDKHYCNSRFLLTRFNSVLQFMYHWKRSFNNS